MPYEIADWDPQAEKHYLAWAKHEPRVAAKIDELLEAVRADPFGGVGKPKYLDGYWSRRITQEHRLFYRVVGGRVYVLSCYGHRLGEPGD
jgi:toxin YoeB